MKDSKKLSAKEVAEMFNLPLVKIQRWVHQGRIPCRFKTGSYFFRESEIRQWAEDHGLTLQSPDRESVDSQGGDEEWSLAQSVAEGGVYFDLEGKDIFEAFSSAVKLMAFPEGKKKKILEELLDREETASTGIGRGVAFPHPRHTLDLGLKSPVVPVVFLRDPIEFNSVDGKPVNILFFIFSPTTKIHLELLCRLSYLLRSEPFQNILKQPKNKQDFLSAVQRIEEGFVRP